MKPVIEILLTILLGAGIFWLFSSDTSQKDLSSDHKNRFFSTLPWDTCQKIIFPWGEILLDHKKNRVNLKLASTPEINLPASPKALQNWVDNLFFLPQEPEFSIQDHPEQYGFSSNNTIELVFEHLEVKLYIGSHHPVDPSRFYLSVNLKKAALYPSPMKANLTWKPEQFLPKTPIFYPFENLEMILEEGDTIKFSRDSSSQNIKTIFDPVVTINYLDDLKNLELEAGFENISENCHPLLILDQIYPIKLCANTLQIHDFFSLRLDSYAKKLLPPNRYKLLPNTLKKWLFLQKDPSEIDIGEKIHINSSLKSRRTIIASLIQKPGQITDTGLHGEAISVIFTDENNQKTRIPSLLTESHLCTSFQKNPKFPDLSISPAIENTFLCVELPGILKK